MNEISAIKKTILIRPINRNSVFGESVGNMQ